MRFFTVKPRKRFEFFLNDCYKALAIDPNYANALLNKGSALSNLGKYEEAIVYYDKVLEVDPKYARALNNKGNAFSQLGKYN